MTAETSKRNRESWRDWLPPGIANPPPLLTRDELLDRLNRAGIDVKLSDLRYWEYEGILPRPELKWDPAVKARRAYYPVAIMASILALRELQGAGLQLGEIAPSLPVAFAAAASKVDNLELPNRPENVSYDDWHDGEVDWLVLREGTHAILDTVRETAVAPALARYARLLERLDLVGRHGEKLRWAEVQFFDDNGRPNWFEKRMMLPIEGEGDNDSRC